MDNRQRCQAFVALQRRSSKYNRSKSKSIEAVRKSYFPQFPYRNFAPLFCKKLRKWNIETSLVGKQKAVQGEKKESKYILSLLVLSLVFIFLNNTLSAICNTEIKATVAQELQAEEFNNTFTNFLQKRGAKFLYGNCGK